MDYYFGNPNPNPYIAPPSDNFLLSDYLMLDDDVGVVDHQESQSTETESSDKAISNDAIHGFGDETSMNNKMQALFLSLFLFFIFHWYATLYYTI